MAALVFEGCIGNELTAAELRRVVVSFLLATLRECVGASGGATLRPGGQVKGMDGGGQGGGE